MGEFIPRSELSEFDLGFGDRGSSHAACLFARTKIPAAPSSGRGALAGGILDSRFYNLAKIRWLASDQFLLDRSVSS